MKKFDVVGYLESRNIQFAKQGKNIGRSGFYGIKECIFCFCDNYHLGISDTGKVNCWKCGKHSLKEFVYKIEKCSWGKVDKIINQFSGIDFDFKEEIENKIADYVLPIGVCELLTDKEKKFLEKRRYNYLDLKKKYSIMSSGRIGRIKNRIIFPIFENNKIVNFCGRSIINNENIMPYMYELDDNNPIVKRRDLLFNLDNCKKDWVILVEGIFDAIRIGDNTVAMLSVNFSKQQLIKLRKFKKFYIMFDNDDPGVKMGKILEKNLIWADSIQYIEYDAKDPDKLSDNDIKLIRRML